MSFLPLLTLLMFSLNVTLYGLQPRLCVLRSLISREKNEWKGKRRGNLNSREFCVKMQTLDFTPYQNPIKMLVKRLFKVQAHVNGDKGESRTEQQKLRAEKQLDKG